MVHFIFIVFNTAQAKKMVLRAFYFIRTLSKALTYYYKKRSQRHLLIAIENKQFGGPIGWWHRQTSINMAKFGLFEILTTSGSQLLMAAVAVVFACVAVSSAKQKQHQRESTTQRICCCNVVAQSVPPDNLRNWKNACFMGFEN